MVNYIKKADGKMAGSIGDGRDSVPTEATISTPAETSPQPPANWGQALAHLDSLTTPVPLEYAQLPWSGNVAWENVAPERREALAWAIDNPTLTFYAPHADNNFDIYADIDVASEAVRVLRSLPINADNATVVAAFDESFSRDYLYRDPLSSDPVLGLWDEWRKDGPHAGTAPHLSETNRARRGHAFYPTREQMPPALYSTENTPLEQTVIAAHYFIGGNDWYIAEYDPETGTAFGYTCLNMDTDNAEWGYVSLPELEQVRLGSLGAVIERDCHWTPKQFSDLGLS
jgi:hypothetical protein